MDAAQNPFRVSRLHRLTYRSEGFLWEDLLGRLARMNCRAAIVGPKGHGKTTLLLELSDRLRAAGQGTLLLRRRVCDRGIAPCGDMPTRDGLAGTIVLLDGAEQLSWFEWLRFQRRCRNADGLVITCHEAGRLPTLHECRTSPRLLRSLLSELEPGSGGAWRGLAADLWNEQGGNLRNVFFALYDDYAAR